MIFMRTLFSKTWNASRQARKQRKYRYNAPLHIKRKFLSAHLAKHLRIEYGRRSAVVRKDDVVKVMRGKFAGKEGKVSGVDMKNSRIFIEGAAVKKAGGKEAQVSIDASNVMIVELNLKDTKRVKALKKQKTAAAPKQEKPAEAPKKAGKKIEKAEAKKE